MNELERRLRHALAVYVSGNRPVISKELVRDAIAILVDIPTCCFSVHEFCLGDFLVVIDTAEHRNAIMALPALEHLGCKLVCRPWNRQTQATSVAMHSKVQLVLEGIPPHAWEQVIVEEMLGTSCVVETLAPELRARSDHAMLRLSAWADRVHSIPTARTLVIPEPEEEEAPLAMVGDESEKKDTLHYRVLIHVDSVDEA
ncbi:unnamed protein product [Alopecurus aequalis]